MAELKEQTAMAQLEERLNGKYSDLPPGRVAAALRDARARFDQSPIRDFIPLLVERRVRESLTSAQ